MSTNFHYCPHRLVVEFLVFDYIHSSLCLTTFSITLRDSSYRMFSQVPWASSASHQGVLEYFILTFINLKNFKTENLSYPDIIQCTF